MNKSIKIFSLLFVAILCMQSCTNDNIENDKIIDDTKTCVNFTPESKALTRAKLEYNVVNKWVEGDTAGVYAFYAQTMLGVPNATYVLTDGIFFQEFNEPKERIAWYNSSIRHTFYMYHPYMSNAADLNNIVFELSNTQTQSEVNKINITQRKSNFLWDAMIGVQRPVSGNMKFKMKPLLPICEFLFSKQDNSLDGYCLSKIELKANNLKAGKLNIDFSKINTYSTTGEFANGLNTSVQSFVLNVPDNAVKMSDYKIGETFSMYLSVNPIESVGNHSVVATFVNPSNKQDVKQITINRTNASFKVENGQGSITRYLFGSSEFAENDIKILYSVTKANNGSTPGFIKLPDGSTVSNTGSVIKKQEEEATVQAIASSGYKFLGWFEGNDKKICDITQNEYSNMVSSDAKLSLKFTADKENKHYYAKFGKVSYTVTPGSYWWWGQRALFIDRLEGETGDALDVRPFWTRPQFGGHQFAKEVFWDNNGPLYMEWTYERKVYNTSEHTSGGLGIWILKYEYRAGAGIGTSPYTDCPRSSAPEGWLKLANDYVRFSDRYFFVPSLGLYCNGTHSGKISNQGDLIFAYFSNDGSYQVIDGSAGSYSSVANPCSRAIYVETNYASYNINRDPKWPYAWFTLKRSIAHCTTGYSNGNVYSFRFHDR